jgi:hypothetical protein
MTLMTPLSTRAMLTVSSRQDNVSCNVHVSLALIQFERVVMSKKIEYNKLLINNCIPLCTKAWESFNQS